MPSKCSAIPALKLNQQGVFGGMRDPMGMTKLATACTAILASWAVLGAPAWSPAWSEDAVKPTAPAATAPAAAPAVTTVPAAETSSPAPAAAATVPPAAAATAPATSTPPAADKGTSGSGWSAEIAPNGKSGLTLDPAQTDIVKKVSDYFGGLNSLKGAFVQTGADKKRMKGKFFLKRPGKFRFDYALPSKQVIVSDGEFLAIQDLDLNNEDRVELDKTPFRLLLRKDVDLARDAIILEVQSADDLIVVALRDKSPDTPGTIKLFLSTAPAVELKEWQSLDAQGQQTQVQVTDLVKGEELDAALFKIQTIGPGRATP
jgi:outer membrane lipoprotein-sorting protein